MDSSGDTGTSETDLLSNVETEKQSALDAIPTSSTDASEDASTSFTKAEAVEDPISSTSSEVCSTRNECVEDEVNQFTSNLSATDINLIIMGDTGGTQEEKAVSEEDFLSLNMSGMPNIKITEDVEDIVQDLENLLGESNDNFTIQRKSFNESVEEKNEVKEPKECVETAVIETKETLQEMEVSESQENRGTSTSLDKLEEFSGVKFAEDDQHVVQTEPVFRSTSTELTENQEDAGLQIAVLDEKQKDKTGSSKRDIYIEFSESIEEEVQIHVTFQEPDTKEIKETEIGDQMVLDKEIEAVHEDEPPADIPKEEQLKEQETQADVVQISEGYEIKIEGTSVYELERKSPEMSLVEVAKMDLVLHYEEQGTTETHITEDKTEVKANNSLNLEEEAEVPSENVLPLSLKQTTAETSINEDKTEIEATEYINPEEEREVSSDDILPLTLKQTTAETLVYEEETETVAATNFVNPEEEVPSRAMLSLVLKQTATETPVIEEETKIEATDSLNPAEETDFVAIQSSEIRENFPESQDVPQGTDGGFQIINNEIINEETEAVPAKETTENVTIVEEVYEENSFCDMQQEEPSQELEEIEENVVGIQDAVIDPKQLELDNAVIALQAQMFEESRMDFVPSPFEEDTIEPEVEEQTLMEVEQESFQIFQEVPTEDIEMPVEEPLTQALEEIQMVVEEPEQEEFEEVQLVEETQPQEIEDIVETLIEKQPEEIIKQTALPQVVEEIFKGLVEEAQSVEIEEEAVETPIEKQSEEITQAPFVEEISKESLVEKAQPRQEIEKVVERPIEKQIDEIVTQASSVEETSSQVIEEIFKENLLEEVEALGIEAVETPIEKQSEDIIKQMSAEETSPQVEEIFKESLVEEIKPQEQSEVHSENIVEQEFAQTVEHLEEFEEQPQENIEEEVREESSVPLTEQKMPPSCAETPLKIRVEEKSLAEEEIGMEAVEAPSVESTDERNNEPLVEAKELLLRIVNEEKEMESDEEMQVEVDSFSLPLMEEILPKVSQENVEIESSGYEPLSISPVDTTLTIEDSDSITPLAESTKADLLLKETISPLPEISEKTDKMNLKITITKHSDSTHSILKVCESSDAQEPKQPSKDPMIPKLIIKSVQKSPVHTSIKPLAKIAEQKISPRSSKQTYSSSTSGSTLGIPKVTIRPVVSPEQLSPLKITIKPVMKPEEQVQQKSSPKFSIKPIVKPEEEDKKHKKITIKPIVKPEEVFERERQKSNPKVTIKPIVKPEEQKYGPKLTIKPIVKPILEEELQHVTKLTIKPIVKPSEEEEQKCSPKLIIKPILKPIEEEEQHITKLIIKPILKPVEEDEQQQVTKLTIKPIVKPVEEEERHITKLTIKPIVKPVEDEGQQITKLTIKPIVKPTEEEEQQQHISKLTIKPSVRPIEEEEVQQHVTKLTIKPIVKPAEEEEGKSSPKLTIKPNVKSVEEEQQYITKLAIKPIVKPLENEDGQHITKLTIKPIVKPVEDEEQKHSPKLTMKQIVKPPEEEEPKCSPKLTIKPIVKPDEYEEQRLHKLGTKLTIQPIQPEEEEEQAGSYSPKITIKPVVRPEEPSHSPRITIKPIPKPEEEQESHSFVSVDNQKPETSGKITLKLQKTEDEEYTCEDSSYANVESPRLTVKPIPQHELIDFEEQIKQERIILKINKRGSTPSRKREHGDDWDKSGKLAKIKVKYSKEGGHAHIIPQSSSEGGAKRQLESPEGDPMRKRFKLDDLNIPHGVTITNVEQDSKLKEILTSGSKMDQMESSKQPAECFKIISATLQASKKEEDMADPLSDIPVFEITPETALAMKNSTPALEPTPTPPAPRKRGRPRKVPLQVREEFKDPKEDEIVIEEGERPPESSRPKRSCRGQSIRSTLGIKTRKPRGGGRGRGRGRGMGSRAISMKPDKDAKISAAKLKLLKESAFKGLISESEFGDVIEIKDVESTSSSTSTVNLVMPDVTRDVPIYEEETRMSAETSSRAQTPAKQVVSSVSADIDESQSSVQSTATTESGKIRKGPRLEVHQEPEGAVISAEQLTEYSWGGGGPYMLQEQVAQFLGIKSFKRKYPGIHRRPLEMQERDFIRESGLASEAMCDLGLTAVNSADILDIMYSDFQPKYEEYCKHQRDRQAKDLINKQKALSLAASQEKNKLDITEQAVQSAASWNANFNKTRKEQRKACMDLQTFTINYPKGKMKQINKNPVGNYPVSLVPGQFVDYYKVYTPTELNNLPFNTMLYDEIHVAYQDNDDSQSDGSGSDSDSSSSDSDSSDSVSSENCTVCSSNVAQKRLTIH